MCGGSKPTTETAPAPAARPSPPKKRPSPSPKKPAKRRRSSVRGRRARRSRTTSDAEARRTPRRPPRWRRRPPRRRRAARARRRRPARVERRRGRACARPADAPGAARCLSAPPSSSWVCRTRSSMGAAASSRRRRRISPPAASLSPSSAADAVAEARERRRRAVGRRRRASPRAAPASSAAPPAPAPAPPPPQTPTIRPYFRRRRAPDFDPARGLSSVLSIDGRPAYAIVARALDADLPRRRAAWPRRLTNALRWGLAAPAERARPRGAVLPAPTRDSQGGGHRLERTGSAWSWAPCRRRSPTVVPRARSRSPDALKAAARRTGGPADCPSSLAMPLPAAVLQGESAGGRRRAVPGRRGRPRERGARPGALEPGEGQPDIAALGGMTADRCPGEVARQDAVAAGDARRGDHPGSDGAAVPGPGGVVRCKGPRVAKTDLQRAGKSIGPMRGAGDVEIVAEAVLGVIRGGESDFHGALVERRPRVPPSRRPPPAPMLANPANSVHARRAPPEVQKGRQEPGHRRRAQVRRPKGGDPPHGVGEVRIFSRKNADIVAQFPTSSNM